MIRKSQKTAEQPKVDRKVAAPPVRYETPRVVTHSGQKILEELGPAQACYPFSSD